MGDLVLSLFPGIGLLDMAFEEVGFCVVRGPDLLWGGDIRHFHPPAGRFDGVIGGPPCQVFSRLRSLLKATGHDVRHGNLIPEFERVVSEVRPRWFLMENVSQAPVPSVIGYQVKVFDLCNRWVGGVQRRKRRFSFGTHDGTELDVDIVALEAFDCAVAVLAGHGPIGRGKNYQGTVSIAKMCELQGLPQDFLDEAPFTVQGKRRVLGNGVPLPMGRAIAQAVVKAVVGDE